MKTYKIIVEVRVDSTNESVDEIITEVGRAIYHAHYYSDTIDNIDSVHTIKVDICQCAYCDNRDRQKAKSKSFNIFNIKSNR